MDWTQVLTIVGANIAMMATIIGSNIAFHLHLDKKIDENRREATDIIKSIQDEMKDFHARLEKQDAEFRGRIEKQDAEFKGRIERQDAEFKAHIMYCHTGKDRNEIKGCG